MRDEWVRVIEYARFELVALLFPSSAYLAFAIIVLLLHALFIAWVALGFLLTRSRPILQWFHIVSLCWAILVEVLPWTCPLTYLENWLEGRAGVEPYQGGFLLHYLDKMVYPDIRYTLLALLAVLVCGANFAFYGWQLWITHRKVVPTS